MIKTGKNIAKARKSFLFLALAMLFFVPLKSQNWVGDASAGNYTGGGGALSFASIGGEYMSTGNYAAGAFSIAVSANSVAVCQTIIIINMTTGIWERSVVKVTDGTNLTIPPLKNDYSTGTIQVIKAPMFDNFTLQAGDVLTPQAWNGTTGGIIWFYVADELIIDGNINLVDAGFTGGATPGAAPAVGAVIAAGAGGGAGGAGGDGETPAVDGADGGAGGGSVVGNVTAGSSGDGITGSIALGSEGGQTGTTGSFSAIALGGGGGAASSGESGVGGGIGGTGGTGGGTLGVAGDAGDVGGMNGPDAGDAGDAGTGIGGRGAGLLYIQATNNTSATGSVSANGSGGALLGGDGGAGGDGGDGGAGGDGDGAMGEDDAGGGGGGGGGLGGKGGDGGKGSGGGAGGAVNIYPATGTITVSVAGGSGGNGGTGSAGMGAGGGMSGGGGDGGMDGGMNGNDGDAGEGGGMGGALADGADGVDGATGDAGSAGVSVASNSAEPLIGTTFYAVSSGEWDNCGTWSYFREGAPALQIPTATDVVVIEKDYVVELNVAGTCKSITLGNVSGTESGELEWTAAVSLTINANAGVVVNAAGILDNNSMGAGSEILFDHQTGGEEFIFSSANATAGAVSIGDLRITETGGTGTSTNITLSGVGTIDVVRDINTVATSAEFINTGIITIFDDFLSTGASHTLTNTGTITTSGSANADILWSGATPIITNTAPGIITTGRNLRFNISATNGTITNTGTITVGQNIVMGATNGTLTNTGGTINVTRHIRFNQATGIFNNTGIVNITESLRTDFAASTPFVLNNSGTMAITLDFLSSGALNTVNNTGGSITMRDLTSTGAVFNHTNSAPFTVTRDASFTGTVTVANGNFNYLVGTGGAGSWVSTGANTLTNILGTWTVQDNMTVGNTSTMNNTGTLTVTAGNVTLGTGNTWTNSATGSTLVAAGNLTIGATSTLNNANVFTVGGNYVSAGDNITLNNTAGTFANTGNMNFGDFVTTVNTASIFNVDGDFQNITSGEVTWNNQAGASTTYAGSTANDPDLDIAANNNANTFNYDRAGDQSIYAPTDAYWHLITSQSGTKTLLANAVINGDHTRSGTAVVGASTFDIDIKGNWVGTSTGAFVPGTGTVTFSGGAAQAISTAAGYEQFYDLTITNTSGGTTFSNDVTVAHDFTYNSATALTPGTNKVTFDGAVAQALNGTGVPDFYDLTLNNVIAAAVTLGANIRISHDLTTTTTLTHGGQTVTLNGATPQTISGGTPPTFHTLVQDGSGGTTVNTNTSIASLLTLTDGLITPGGGTLKILNGGSASAGSAITYVNGALIKVGNVPFTFPVGSTRYGAISVSGIGGGSATTELTGEYFDAGPSNSGSLEAGIHHISNLEYWDVSNGTSDVTAATVTLSTTAVSGTTIVLPAVASDLLVVHYESGEWKNVGVGTSGTVTSFSPFAYGSRHAAITLPVELLSFSGSCTDDETVFKWSTGTEINNDYFELLASRDGVAYDNVGVLEGAGNSTSLINYEYSCETCQNQDYSYYKIKQVDFDDVHKISDAIHFQCEQARSYVMYPGIIDQEIAVLFNGFEHERNDINVLIVDQMGKTLMSRATSKAKETFQVGSLNMKPGMYYLVVQSGDYKSSKYFIKL